MVVVVLMRMKRRCSDHDLIIHEKEKERRAQTSDKLDMISKNLHYILLQHQIPLPVPFLAPQ